MKKQHYHPLRVFVSITTIALLLVLFDFKGLQIWFTRLKSDYAQAMLEPAISGLAQFNEATGAGTIRHVIRSELFEKFRDSKFSKPAGKIKLETSELKLADSMAWMAYIGKNIDKDLIYSAKRPLEILLIGDSLAQSGLPAAMYEKIKGNPAITFNPQGKISSTLNEPSYYDWQKNIFQLFDEKYQINNEGYDLIICLIGGNDAQTIKQTEKGPLKYGTDDWDEEHIKRITLFAKSLLSHTTKIYWFNLPPMGLEGYKDRMVHVNGNYEKALNQFPEIKLIKTDTIIGDENGNYVKTKIIDSQIQVIREVDSIHFTLAGARIIAGRIMKELQEDFVFAN